LDWNIAWGLSVVCFRAVEEREHKRRKTTGEDCLKISGDMIWLAHIIETPDCCVVSCYGKW